MFASKAIKQVLSKYAIDLDEASELHKAIEIIDQSEILAQKMTAPKYYPEERFIENFPKWVKLVSAGDKKAESVISLLDNSYEMTPDQKDKLKALKQLEPIEGDIS